MALSNTSCTCILCLILGEQGLPCLPCFLHAGSGWLLLYRAELSLSWLYSQSQPAVTQVAPADSACALVWRSPLRAHSCPNLDPVMVEAGCLDTLDSVLSPKII